MKYPYFGYIITTKQVVIVRYKSRIPGCSKVLHVGVVPNEELRPATKEEVIARFGDDFPEKVNLIHQTNN